MIGWCSRRRCDQHPRVVAMAQQDAPDAQPIVTYSVEGLPQHYYSAEAAIEASEANPA